MLGNFFFGSVTRISDLADKPASLERLPRSAWATGDYVVGEVIPPPSRLPIELATGRHTLVMPGDAVVGALGARRATLEAVGDWQQIRDDGIMHALTGAGLFGQTSSKSAFLPHMITMVYRGHVVRAGTKVTMQDFVAEVPPRTYACPTVLVIGTSMSSGKTTSAKIIVRLLKQAGLKIVGVKLTGAGRYRDILAMSDAGADTIFDFMDAGLPSTVCPTDQYDRALTHLLALIAAERPDAVVAEAGASPLEPYNGDRVVAAIREDIRCTVLCASDPYAVVGVTKGFGFKPDLVSGVATSTSAGVDLIEKLAGVTALNLLEVDSHARLMEILRTKLGL